MRVKLALILLCSLCVIGSGCTTVRGVPINGTPSQVARSGVKPGKKVLVTMKDETTHEMIVTAVDPTGVTGHDAGSKEEFRLAYTDMQAMEIKAVSGKRTFGLVAGVVVVALGAATVALLHAIAEGDD
jgi:hypothetical protein